MKDSTDTGAVDTHGLPPTQLLERNVDRIQGARLLLLGVPKDPKVVSLFRHQSGVLQSFDYGAHLLNAALLRAGGAGLAPVFAATCAPSEPRFDLVVAYLQKGKEANDCLLSTAGSVVSPGGRVILVGENAAGIRSFAARLEERVGPIEFSDAARHCVLYEARSTGIRPEVRLEAWEKRFHAQTSSGGVDVVTLPGVFSHGRLDEGTAFLLPHLPPSVHGAVLDFGCGSGVIGAVIKSHSPGCEVSLVDSNAFALLAAERTFSVNGLAARAIRPVDGIDGVGDQTFDLIVSNPPFHQGIGTDYDVVGRFLQQCEQRLNSGGVVLMVANRFLPYERMMPKALQMSNVAENAKYKVLKGRLAPAPRRARPRD
ncbi:MAG: class I SAM-dependent methyltransferase [Vicinamibacterales bacterium]